jgi:hypothetical protein
MACELLRWPRMAQPLRRFDPRAIYFITSRTMQSRPFMAPGDEADALIGGVLARAVHLREVELFAHVFASDHFHLMIRASSAIEMSKFMQRLRSGIGMKVGHLAGWSGRFFAGRHQAEPISEEEDQLNHLLYILRHGVDEGLDSTRWPGLSCLQPVREGRTAVHQRRSDFAEPLWLTPLPGWARLARARREQIIEQMLGSRSWKRERKRAPGGAALPQLRSAAM